MGILGTPIPERVSDAIVPATATPKRRWSDPELDESGPPRSVAADPDALPQRDPEITLNYKQLLSVCGTATNAFSEFGEKF